MKPIARADGEKLKTGFDVEKFKAALSKKSISVKENALSAGKAHRLGVLEHKNGVLPKHPENSSYMDGWNSYEPLIITRRCEGKKTQYSLANCVYHRDLPEWYSSIPDALYYSRATEKDSNLYLDRVTEHHHKHGTFDSKIARDALIKPDVNRLYQSTIDGGISTSTDGGVTWFDGGIMSSPSIPVVVRQVERWNGRYVQCQYIECKAGENDLKKGSLTKIKPPMPVRPVGFNDYSWWKRHIHLSDIGHIDGACFLGWQIAQNAKPKDFNYQHRIEVVEWRCKCYHAKVSAHDKAVQQYKKSLEKWESL